MTHPHAFNRSMLPILGVKWVCFPSLREAQKFAAWAERETKHDRHPCDAYVYTRDDLPPDERYEVKIRNW